MSKTDEQWDKDPNDPEFWEEELAKVEKSILLSP